VADDYTCLTSGYHGRLGLTRWKRGGCLICPSCAAVGKELGPRNFRAIASVDDLKSPSDFMFALNSVDTAVKAQGHSPHAS
jgi:hypothetical protein